MDHNMLGQVEVLRLIYVFNAGQGPFFKKKTFNIYHQHNLSFLEQLAFLDKCTLVCRLFSNAYRRHTRATKVAEVVAPDN